MIRKVFDNALLSNDAYNNLEYLCKKAPGILMGYRTDSQRHMDLHHSAYDTFDKVNIRELQLGSGCMTAIIYLVDKYGF